MKTSAAGRAAIRREEGEKLVAYKDSVGIWTIGVGHTTAAGAPAVKAGTKITAEQSDAILAKDLAGVEATVSGLVRVPLTQNQFDALVSLTFNIGGGALAMSSLLKKLNAGDKQGAADQFLVWNKGRVAGKLVVLKGLAARRQRERALFLTAAMPAAAQFVALPAVEPEDTASGADEPPADTPSLDALTQTVTTNPLAPVSKAIAGAKASAESAAGTVVAATGAMATAQAFLASYGLTPVMLVLIVGAVLLFVAVGAAAFWGYRRVFRAKPNTPAVAIVPVSAPQP